MGPVRDLNPGPLAPKARIIPLDQLATSDMPHYLFTLHRDELLLLIYSGNKGSPETEHQEAVHGRRLCSEGASEDIQSPLLCHEHPPGRGKPTILHRNMYLCSCIYIYIHRSQEQLMMKTPQRAGKYQQRYAHMYVYIYTYTFNYYMHAVCWRYDVYVYVLSSLQI